jgi:hypothetical protein
MARLHSGVDFALRDYFLRKSNDLGFGAIRENFLKWRLRLCQREQ